MPPEAGFGAPNTPMPVTPNRVDTTTQTAFAKKRKKGFQQKALESKLEKREPKAEEKKESKKMERAEVD